MNQSRISAATSYLIFVIMVVCFAVIGLERAQIFPDLTVITTRFYTWAALLGAFALLLGVANVLWVHFGRVQYGEADWTQSLALVATAFAVLLAGLLDSAGVESPLVEWIFDSIIAPGQATLFALLAFFTAVAGYRYLRVNRPGGGWLLAGAVLMLVTQTPLLNVALPQDFVAAVVWLLETPAMAALRGVLLGSSIALVIVGIRLLIGRS